VRLLWGASARLTLRTLFNQGYLKRLRLVCLFSRRECYSTCHSLWTNEASAETEQQSWRTMTEDREGVGVNTTATTTIARGDIEVIPWTKGFEESIADWHRRRLRRPPPTTPPIRGASSCVAAKADSVHCWIGLSQRILVLGVCNWLAVACSQSRGRCRQYCENHSGQLLRLRRHVYFPWLGCSIVERPDFI